MSRKSTPSRIEMTVHRTLWESYVKELSWVGMDTTRALEKMGLSWFHSSGPRVRITHRTGDAARSVSPLSSFIREAQSELSRISAGSRREVRWEDGMVWRARGPATIRRGGGQERTREDPFYGTKENSICLWAGGVCAELSTCFSESGPLCACVCMYLYL